MNSPIAGTCEHKWKTLGFESAEHMIEEWSKIIWVKEFVPGALFTPFDNYDKKFTEEEIATALETGVVFTDVVEAWNFLDEHPAFLDVYGDSRFKDSLWIDYQKVNPVTNSVDDDRSLNTKTEVWLETGYFLGDYEQELLVNRNIHDTHLDCGGDTFEEAIINLAKLVSVWYGTWVEPAFTQNIIDDCIADAQGFLDRNINTYAEIVATHEENKPL